MKKHHKIIVAVIAGGLLGVGAFLVGQRDGSVGEDSAAESEHARTTSSPIAAAKAQGRPPVEGAANPPRFVTQPAQKHVDKIENDPTSAGYDPVTLFKTTNMKLNPIFDAEPRAETWAKPKEEFLSSTARQDLEGSNLGVELVSVECRTATCRLVIKSPSKEALEKASLLLQYTPLASIFQPGTLLLDKDGNYFMTPHLAWRPEDHPPDVWRRNYPAWRRQALARRRAQGELPSNYPPIPAE